MKKKKYIDILVPVLMIIAVVGSLYIAYAHEKAELVAVTEVEQTYETSLFDDTRVQSVDIIMDESSWQEMLEHATAEQFYACDVIVNGITYKNVGIRPKGNTSLTMIASDNTTDRYSFKIDFGKYIDGQTCDGLDVLMLNNLMSDATYMKEYLAYDLFEFMNVNASMTAFTEVKVNGEAWGLYLAIEGLEESFAQRTYGYSHGKLYKPESEQTEGGGGGKTQGFEKAVENSNGKREDFSGFGTSGNGAGLVYTDDDVESYSDIFNNAVFDTDAEDKERVIEALKNINEGTELEKYVDVDQMLRYIAVNVVLVNLDSYFGNMLHNYYLYEENGQLSMIPWDYNLAFGGFQGNSADSAVNLAIDTVVSGANLEERPMIAKLLEVEKYKETYHEYLQQIVTEYFESGYFTNKIQYVDSLISTYVESDATAFYSYEEYKTAVETLRAFGLLRSQSIQGQLNGTIPSTEEEQKADSSKLVDASSINLSDMGTMMGGGGGRMSQMPGSEVNGQGFGRPQKQGNEAEGPGAGEIQMPEEMPAWGEKGESYERPQMPEGMMENREQKPQANMPMGNSNLTSRENSQYAGDDWILLGISLGIMIVALLVVKQYKKRKFSTK